MTYFLPENDQELRDGLSELAESVVAHIIDQDPGHHQELLSAFVSQLFLCATRQSMREERKARQAEGIAKAKAKGVSFGRKLPSTVDCPKAPSMGRCSGWKAQTSLGRNSFRSG